MLLLSILTKFLSSILLQVPRKIFNRRNFFVQMSRCYIHVKLKKKKLNFYHPSSFIVLRINNILLSSFCEVRVLTMYLTCRWVIKANK